MTFHSENHIRILVFHIDKSIIQLNQWTLCCYAQSVHPFRLGLAEASYQIDCDSNAEDDDSGCGKRIRKMGFSHRRKARGLMWCEHSNLADEPPPPSPISSPFPPTHSLSEKAGIQLSQGDLVQIMGWRDWKPLVRLSVRMRTDWTLQVTSAFVNVVVSMIKQTGWHSRIDAFNAYLN